MNTKLALNKFNCGQSNFSQKAYNIKCYCLPKEDKRKNRELLKLMQTLKRG